jgi:hypothetical protein
LKDIASRDESLKNASDKFYQEHKWLNDQEIESAIYYD